MDLLLARHGQTDHNASDTVQGHMEVELNETGRDQSVELGSRIDTLVEEIDAVYSSDLKRAKQTAQLAFDGRDVTYDERLRGIDFGDVEGNDLDRFLRNNPDYSINAPNSVYRPFPGGESIMQAYDRVKGCLEDIVESHADDATVVILTHSTSILCVQSFIEDIPIRNGDQPANCDILHVTVEDEEYEVQRWYEHENQIE